MFAPLGHAACIFNVFAWLPAIAIFGIATAAVATAPALAAVLKNFLLEETLFFSQLELWLKHQK